MRFNGTVFFHEYKEGPKVSIKTEKTLHYPATIRITKSGEFFDQPSITFHLSSISDLIEFKNSVIGAFNKAMRRVGYDR